MTVEIRGQEKLLRKLRKLNPRQLETSLQAGGEIVVGEMVKYPPPPSGSSYVRTGALGRSWKAKPQRSDFAVKVFADDAVAPYAPYVEGDKTQASIHRGRWQTLVSTAKEKVPDIVKRLKQQVDRILRTG
jgi:hypothetical protein